MRVLVTGASGFIGSHLCERLVGAGYAVRAMVRPTSNRQWLEGLPVEFCVAQLEDERSLAEAVEGVEVVFHSAAVVRARRGEDFLRVNYDGTRRLAEVAVHAGVRRMVLFSSLAAAGPGPRGGTVNEKEAPAPMSDYGRAKLAAERALVELKEKIEVVVLRFPAVYGPRDRDGLLLWRMFQRGVVPVLGRTFSLIYVRDAVKAAALAGTKRVASGATYFISDGVCYSYSVLAQVWQEVTGRRVVCVRVPGIVALLFARVNNWLAREGTIFNPDKVRDLCQECWFCFDERAGRELGFYPDYDLRQGVRETLNWYREKGWL